MSDVDQLGAALSWARRNDVRTLILGGGSNLVIADQGFDGLAIDLAICGIEWGADADPALVRAGAGEEWDAFVGLTVEGGRTGIECLAGIPGNVGATPIQNVGAYGQEVAQVIQSVSGLRTDDGSWHAFGPEACEFGYRDSAFKRDPEGFIVTEVAFRLPIGPPAEVRYGELSRALPPDADLATIRACVLDLRARKSMVLRPDDPNRRSVGSFFTNPIVSRERADEIAEQAVRDGLSETTDAVPQFPASDGRIKLAAAWLIERSGIAKGTTHGNVGVSSAHTLALVHHGGGTTAELLALAAHVRDNVWAKFGVELVPEPRLIGVELPPKP